MGSYKRRLSLYEYQLCFVGLLTTVQLVVPIACITCVLMQHNVQVLLEAVPQKGMPTQNYGMNSSPIGQESVTLISTVSE